MDEGINLLYTACNEMLYLLKLNIDFRFSGILEEYYFSSLYHIYSRISWTQNFYCNIFFQIWKYQCLKFSSWTKPDFDPEKIMKCWVEQLFIAISKKKKLFSSRSKVNVTMLISLWRLLNNGVLKTLNFFCMQLFSAKLNFNDRDQESQIAIWLYEYK